MKKIMLIAVLISSAYVTMTAQSPNYVNFEWDVIKLGYATPIGSESASGGIAFGTEVRFNFADNMSVGLCLEGAGFSSDFASDNQDVGISSLAMVVADSYLSGTSKTRGFFGLGIGTMSSANITVNNGNASDPEGSSSSFGIAPRIGLELGHLRMMAQYNHSFNSETTNYLGVTVALTLWGGYKGE